LLRAVLLLLALLAGCAAPQPDGAPGGAPGGAACGFTQSAALPLSFIDRLPHVPALVDDAPVQLLLDTGASLTSLTAATASRIGLAAEPGRRVLMAGVGGGSVAPLALVHRMQFGAVGLGPVEVPLLPFALAPPGVARDGLLGRNVLGRLDLDIDLPRARVIVYRGTLCPGLPPHWQQQPGVAELRVRVPASGAMLLAVAVDGRPAWALVDTGASRSVIRPELAQALGATEAMLAGARAVTVQGAAEAVTHAPVVAFGSIRVGRVLWERPAMLVAALPDPDVDVLLGADFLRQVRVWLSGATGRAFAAPG
jgi:predicted aspartyl protease